jgi:serine/arginine repetitive matrix protein 1
MNSDKRYKESMERKLKEFSDIELSKVLLEKIKPWIGQSVKVFIGVEDEILELLIFQLLQETKHPNPKRIYDQLVGFFGDKTYDFMQKLWSRLETIQNDQSSKV